MQKLCPAVLTKQTGLPPKEQLAIVENPACIPLPDLSAEALASIDKAVDLTSAAVGKLPGMIEVEDLLATVAESGALTEPHMIALREAYQLCKKEYAVRTDKDRGEVMAADADTLSAMIASGNPNTQNTCLISVSNVSCEVVLLTGRYKVKRVKAQTTTKMCM